MIRLSITCLVLFGMVRADVPSVMLPVQHWGYAYLDRLEAKGLINTHDLRARPLSRRRIAELVKRIRAESSRRPDVLTRAELLLLSQLESDLSDELEGEIEPEPHIMTWQEQGGRALFDLAGSQRFIAARSDSILSETTLGAIVRGHVGNTLGFYLEAHNSAVRGQDHVEENFDPSQGTPIVTSGRSAYRDRANAYFVWGGSRLHLQIGRDTGEWGPGYRGGLTLSRNMPAADMLRITSCFSRFKFVAMHAFLNSGVGTKYLAAHRLDLMVTPGLYFGASETVVYGGRDPELAYLNPIMPYHIAEHHLGDRDNNALSFDITTTLIRGTKLYAELFIDDMTTTKHLTRYFGNKFAFLIGGLWVEPMRLRNIDLRAEYTRIEPYVYTHWDTVNIYTHYDKIIGHWLGPNSDAAYMEVGMQLGRDLRLEIAAERVRQKGGKADTRSRPAAGENKTFLQKPVLRRHALQFNVTQQVRRDLFVSLGAAYVDIRTPSGAQSHDVSARFELVFNY